MIKIIMFLQISHLFFKKLFFLPILLFITSCESKNVAPDFIDLNDDIRLLKSDKNDNGCTSYTPISKSGKPVVAVLYFINSKFEVINSSDDSDCI